MNHWSALLQRARTSLFVLGSALVLCLALLLLSHRWSAQQQAALRQSQSELTAQMAMRSAGSAELLYLQSHIGQFRRLGQLGLIGQADRESWVQQLLESHQRAALPGPLQWTLHAPEPLASRDAAAPSQDNEARIHELEFSLSAVHEEEVLALLQDFADRVKGRMRVNSCSFSQPTREGLNAHCSLRFFTLAGSAGPAAPEPPQKAASAPAASPILGPLLYSRQDRAAIVQARAARGMPEGRTRMQLSGLVRREAGKGTVWINRHALAEGEAMPPAKHTRITPAGVTIDGQRMRVGETLDLHSHERSDLVAPGALAVKGQP
jgi:hypothetical protein